MSSLQTLRTVLTVAMAATALPLAAQTPGPSSAQRSLAATLGVHAFPSEGQKSEQQSKDESECYKWGVQNTGIDPFQVANQTRQQAAQAGQNAQAAKAAGTNAGARGAVKGAAGGALVGAIAGDTGAGAAIGAGVGIVAGRAKKRRAEEEAKAHEQQAQAVQQSSNKQTDNFKKAFGACLEAKKYLVKY